MIFFTIFLICLCIFFINKKLILHPLMGVSLGYLLYFILPYWFYKDGMYVKTLSDDVVYYIILTYLSYLFGIIFFYIVFLTKVNILNNSLILFKKNKIKIELIGVILIIFKILHLISGYKTNAINSINSHSVFDIFIVLLDMFSLLYVFILSYFIVLNKKTKFILIYLLILILDTGYGSKSKILFELLPLLVWYIYLYKKIPWKIIILVFVVTLVIFPLSLGLKYNKEYANNINLLQMINLGMDLVKEGKLSVTDMIIGRLNMIESLKRIFEYQNLYNEFLNYYPMHNTIFPLFFLSFIPHFVINRIDSNPGGYFGYVFGWISSPSDTYVSSSLIGEFFINFGWYSLLFMFILGVLHYIIYYWFFLKGKNLFFKIVYIYFYLYVILTGIESYFVIRYNIFLKNFFIMFLLYLFIKKISYIKVKGK